MPNKKTSVNKSQAIREHLMAYPNVGPSAVVEAMKAQGIDVSPNFVSNIKLKMKKADGKPPKKRGRKAKAKPEGLRPAAKGGAMASPGVNGYGPVVSAAKFISGCKTVAEARHAFDAAVTVIETAEA